MNIKTKIEYFLTKPFFIIFSLILKKYNPSLFLLDSQGIFTRRNHNDNFFYLFKTGNSCDAFPMMQAMTKKVTKGNIAIDVGANIGITSLWLAKYHKKVYAFEPEPRNCHRLIENCKINHIESIELVKKAVSSKNGILDFYILTGYGHHSLGEVTTSKIVGKKKVKTVSLNSFCNKNKIDKIDTLKIDVEGFEEEVLSGAKKLLAKKKIKVIIFEVSKVPLESLNKNPNDLLNLLNKYKYTVFDMNDKKVDSFNLSEINHEDFYAI